MTWREWLTARSLLAEEFIWAPRREADREAAAAENAAFKKAMSTARP